MASVVFSLLYSLRFMIRSRISLHLEIIALQHQLAVVNRLRRPRFRLTSVDRMLWAWFARSWRGWRSAIHIRLFQVPEQGKTASVPRDDGFRLDDVTTAHPTTQRRRSPPATQPSWLHSISSGQPSSESPSTPKPMPQFGEAAPLAVIQAESLPFEPRLEDAFSSHKNAMMLSCSCRSQLHNIATKNGNGNTSEVYVGVTRSSFGTVRAHAAV